MKYDHVMAITFLKNKIIFLSKYGRIFISLLINEITIVLLNN